MVRVDDPRCAALFGNRGFRPHPESHSASLGGIQFSLFIQAQGEFQGDEFRGREGATDLARHKFHLGCRSVRRPGVLRMDLAARAKAVVVLRVPCVDWFLACDGAGRVDLKAIPPARGEPMGKELGSLGQNARDVQYAAARRCRLAHTGAQRARSALAGRRGMARTGLRHH